MAILLSSVLGQANCATYRFVLQLISLAGVHSNAVTTGMPSDTSNLPRTY